jgi:chromosome transmission fidelity protein 8
MILPLTLPSASSSSTSAGTLPPALAQLGSSELFLLELQGELEVSGDKRGQVVGRLTIDDSDSGKVRPALILILILILIPISLLSLSFSFSSGGGCGPV